LSTREHYSALLASLFVACTTPLPRSPTTTHDWDDFVEVPYPPPAALIETLPPRPSQTAVWVHGYWDWAQERYVWVRGGWVDPPEGYRHAPWLSLYTPDGRLLFARTTWVDGDGRRVANPKVVAPAYTPPNHVTSEFQTPR
jgi:hypothetical protein